MNFRLVMPNKKIKLKIARLFHKVYIIHVVGSIVSMSYRVFEYCDAIHSDTEAVETKVVYQHVTQVHLVFSYTSIV